MSVELKEKKILKAGHILISIVENEKNYNFTFSEDELETYMKKIISSKSLSSSSVVKIIGNSECIKKCLLKIFIKRKRPKLKCLKSKGQIEYMVSRIDKSIKIDSRKTELYTEEPKVSVYLVDDSKAVLKVLCAALAGNNLVEIVGSTTDPYVALKEIPMLNPDVVTLDINMPKLNGVELLKKVSPQVDSVFLMITGLNFKESRLVFDSLESGAFDYIEKPSLEELKVYKLVLFKKIVTAYFSRKKANTQGITDKHRIGEMDLITIGSSTGGTEALKKLLGGIVGDIPPIVIVQHIPPIFSKAFADRLNSLFDFNVQEAEKGQVLCRNNVYIAPGGQQMRIKFSREKMIIEITDDAPVNRFKPSVDYLFKSIAKSDCRNKVGIILTGMGKDGAEGLLELRAQGARTIAQDEKSSVVFGMPMQAIKLNAAEFVCSLNSIPQKISEISRKKQRKVS